MGAYQVLLPRLFSDPSALKLSAFFGTASSYAFVTFQKLHFCQNTGRSGCLWLSLRSGYHGAWQSTMLKIVDRFDISRFPAHPLNVGIRFTGSAPCAERCTCGSVLPCSWVKCNPSNRTGVITKLQFSASTFRIIGIKPPVRQRSCELTVEWLSPSLDSSEFQDSLQTSRICVSTRQMAPDEMSCLPSLGVVHQPCSAPASDSATSISLNAFAAAVSQFLRSQNTSTEHLRCPLYSAVDPQNHLKW